MYSRSWHRFVEGHSAHRYHDLSLGWRIRDGETSKMPAVIPDSRRYEHIAVLGKTGTWKSSFLKHFGLQDIRADRGSVFFDLHGDAPQSRVFGGAECY